MKGILFMKLKDFKKLSLGLKLKEIYKFNGNNTYEILEAIHY